MNCINCTQDLLIQFIFSWRNRCRLDRVDHHPGPDRCPERSPGGRGSSHRTLVFRRSVPYHLNLAQVHTLLKWEGEG